MLVKIVYNQNMLQYETEFLSKGYRLIAGIDEAGRGPLAGPVVCACVVMPLDEHNLIEGVDDSKKLSEKKREELYEKILEKALAYHVSFVSQEVIDTINILNATKQGMQECVQKLSLMPDVVLVDAVKLSIPHETKAIIHGDALSYSIACASILAKVSRDRYLKEVAKLHPLYEFENHKGYGTKRHIELIKQYGACELHRKTFIKNFVS